MQNREKARSDDSQPRHFGSVAPALQRSGSEVLEQQGDSQVQSKYANQPTGLARKIHRASCWASAAMPRATSPIPTSTALAKVAHTHRLGMRHIAQARVERRLQHLPGEVQEKRRIRSRYPVLQRAFASAAR